MATGNEHDLPPPPNGNVLSLVSALSQTQNHALHVQAIQARDKALSSSLDSYGDLCLQLAFLTVGSDQPEHLLRRIQATQAMEMWAKTDLATATQIQHNPNAFVAFGQMAGLVLKSALLRPPPLSNGNHHRAPFLEAAVAAPLKETLLYGFSLQHAPLRNVITSIVADCAVSCNGIQPYLHISNWPQLMPTLLRNLDPNSHPSPAAMQSSLSTVQKMLEDDPEEIPATDLDALVPLLLQMFGSPNDESHRLGAVESIATCLAYGLIPNALVVRFSEYLDGLSRLSTDPSAKVRKAVGLSLVTLLDVHTQYLQPQWPSICQFMLQTSVRPQHQQQKQLQGQPHFRDDDEIVCTQACEFWLVFANLDESLMTTKMMDTVQSLLPQLIPTLLNNMVYSEEQRIDLVAQNELDMENDASNQQSMKPVFHRTKSNKHDGGNVDENNGEGDDDDDDGFDDDNDDLEWNLRKYAGASLDSLASLYGAGPILPALLPSLEQGLCSGDAWIQEASILALGAIADGCRIEMNVHIGNLYHMMMTVLAQPETPDNLPQLKCICSWTIGRYAEWAINEVQTGAQANLLAQTTQVILQRLNDKNRKVQVACSSALGVFIEAAGDLMAPLLSEMLPVLVSAMSRYQGRSLVIVFDTLGIMADSIGPAVGEGHLPSIYVTPLLAFWSNALRQDPTNQILLSLMESLGAIALACGMNFQPFALQTFETCMAIIEQIQLMLATIEDPSEEDAAPIICATDLMDGLCEGMGQNFSVLVQSSSRYGQYFISVLHALCSHQVAGVRMSALALLGDLARNTPSMLLPALPQLVQDAMMNLEPNGSDELSASLCNNAAWAIGEICVQCGENSTPLEPFAANLMQRLISLLMGNNIVSTGARKGYATEIPGLAENAAACVGRLANVNPMFVAPELPRFLLGWCDGMSRIADMDEKRDAFNGFCKAMYANPQGIQQVGGEVYDAISSIIFAIVTWHLPPEAIEMGSLMGDFDFQPFPPALSDLGNRLAQLLRDIQTSVGEQTWHGVKRSLTVKVRRLMREVYHLDV